MNRCKYCMRLIPYGSFCCRSCYGEFERVSENDDIDNEEDYKEEEND